MPADPLRLFTLLYCGCLALQTLYRFSDQLRFFRTAPARLYGPPPRFAGVLPLAVPPEPVFIAGGVGFIAALGLAAAGIAPRFALVAAALCFVVYFPPILPISYLRRKANLVPIILLALALAPGSALELTKLAITMVYLSAGLEKLRTSGLRWMDGRSLAAYLRENYLYVERPAALWLADRPLLCRLLSIGTEVWELTFWLVLFFPALTWFYVAAGIGFHIVTAVTMRIQYWIYFGPAYLVFLCQPR